MLSSRRLLFAILIGALVIAAVLLPDEDEKVTMLLRDKEYAEAYQKLNELYLAGNRQSHILMQLVKLNELYGFVDKIEPILKTYQQAHPRDVAANIKLKDFYFDTIQFPAYLKQLEILIELDPKAEYIDPLMAHSRFNGDINEELRLLEKYRDNPIFTASHAARLGMIYLNITGPDRTLRAFRLMDKLDRDSDDYWEARLAMFRLLINEKRVEEAFNRSSHWVAKDKNGRHLQVLLKQLENRGRTDLAIALSEKAFRRNPNVAFVLANLLINAKQFTRAQFYLARWKAKNEFPAANDIIRYVKLNIAAKNLAAAVKLLVAVGINKVPEEALLSIGDELIYENQTALLKAIRPFLTIEGLGDHPLFAAQLFYREGDRDLARHFLKKVSPTDLPAYKSIAWFSLYKSIYGKYEVVDYVGQLMSGNRLPDNLIREYADTAFQLGLMREYELAWAALGGHQQ